MATLRQYLSLVICLSVLFVILVLTCLPPHGQWSPPVNISLSLHAQEATRGSGSTAPAADASGGDEKDSQARDKPAGHLRGNTDNAGGSARFSQTRKSRLFARDFGRRTAGGAEIFQARKVRPPAVPQDRCRSGEVPLNFTAQELALADIEPQEITPKWRTLAKSNPEMESKISALLKSRNSCWRRNSTSTPDDDSRLACLPYYYLAGFPKCGSTDLYRRLTLHPDIAHDGRYRKELQWITRGRFNFSSGLTDGVESYKSFIANILLSSNRSVEKMSKVVVGDNSVSTMWDNRQWRFMPANQHCSYPRVITADVVRHLNPDAKIIVIVRNPTDRLYSEHLYFHNNSTKEIFHRQALSAVREATKCFKRNSVRQCVYADLDGLKPRIHVGLYNVYIADWLQRFPRDQLHVIRLEDVAVKGWKEVLREAFTFLGVGWPDEASVRAMLEMPVVRAGRKAAREGPMLHKSRVMLDDFYRPFNRQLATLLHDRRNGKAGVVNKVSDIPSTR